MRKSMWLGMAVVIAIVLTGGMAALAQETGLKVNATFQQTWNDNQGSQNSGAQEALIYGNYKNLMIGVEACQMEDYSHVRPLMGVNMGAWSSYLGGSFSTGNDHLFPGLDLNGSWRGLSIFFSGRQYLGIRGNQGDFSDLFLKFTYPFGGSFFVGVDLAGDYYWKSGDSWFLVGPFLGYNISSGVSLFVRPSRSWTFSNEGPEYSDWIRVGVTFSF